MAPKKATAAPASGAAPAASSKKPERCPVTGATEAHDPTRPVSEQNPRNPKRAIVRCQLVHRLTRVPQGERLWLSRQVLEDRNSQMASSGFAYEVVS